MFLPAADPFHRDAFRTIIPLFHVHSRMRLKTKKVQSREVLSQTVRKSRKMHIDNVSGMIEMDKTGEFYRKKLKDNS